MLGHPGECFPVDPELASWCRRFGFTANHFDPLAYSSYGAGGRPMNSPQWIVGVRDGRPWIRRMPAHRSNPVEANETMWRSVVDLVGEEPDVYDRSVDNRPDVIQVWLRYREALDD